MRTLTWAGVHRKKTSYVTRVGSGETTGTVVLLMADCPRGGLIHSCVAVASCPFWGACKGNCDC
jgi:hypothetical protein